MGRKREEREEEERKAFESARIPVKCIAYSMHIAHLSKEVLLV